VKNLISLWARSAIIAMPFGSLAIALPASATAENAVVECPVHPLSDAATFRQMAVDYRDSGKTGSEQELSRVCFEGAAEMGDGFSMAELGAMYFVGKVVPKNIALAISWYEKAAAKNDTYAMSQLGLLYINGKDMPVDYVKARAWSEKAAVDGDVVAQNSLGYIFDRGWGVTQDYETARAWFEKSALKLDGIALYELGNYYRFGKGVAKDPWKGAVYYARSQDNHAWREMGIMLYNGEGMTSDKAAARTWLEKAAAAGNERAKADLLKIE
jgi:uncharacterized protein